ncbi:hypothetical protein BT67DRAFT_232259 [Trichocladium antarcticum]|uniref:Uncharacterized protein n=1 Tax=Trichocladium antarcticum TaxID=1450529 RepID=A0AAN6UNR8_9PEZI|nr:hypothetical protein BT67DRAFT_232259 [Trichocladium antarcticum]
MRKRKKEEGKKQKRNPRYEEEEEGVSPNRTERPCPTHCIPLHRRKNLPRVSQAPALPCLCDGGGGGGKSQDRTETAAGEPTDRPDSDQRRTRMGTHCPQTPPAKPRRSEYAMIPSSVCLVCPSVCAEEEGKRRKKEGKEKRKCPLIVIMAWPSSSFVMVVIV